MKHGYRRVVVNVIQISQISQSNINRSLHVVLRVACLRKTEVTEILGLNGWRVSSLKQLASRPQLQREADKKRLANFKAMHAAY